MPLHPQAAEFLDMLHSWDAFNLPEPTIDEMRRLTDLAGFAERRELPQVTDLAVAGAGGPIRVRLYRPPAAPGVAPPALIYLHGGGWVLGGLDHVDVGCRELAARVGCVVLSVDYRLAPEHRFPAAVEDAWAVTAAAVRDAARFGVDPGAVAVAGDSAGGNLAAVVALLARDRGLHLAHQLLIYPVTDTAMNTPSHRAFATGYGLDGEGLGRFMKLYRGSADPADPRIAPLRAPVLSGLAPATVITAEYDILRDEGEAYARRLAEAGVEVELRRFEGMVHSFFLMPEIFDSGAEAQELAVRRLRAAFDHAISGEAGAA
ncbi:alpha/beta hydrolase [Actinomadura barringtoniae]|uniref:Alpha/beta hydrolase n=1 Tax=Actinomadura barringtoniae TaxID=1427535 RepID=A0A939T1G5_9ACTN|nr:alpha/beta hydrolase [Actinomadura barringtoniae]MBO2447531.1 alpha/beta hydrolase [Actinomadura barringtoniae]